MKFFKRKNWFARVFLEKKEELIILIKSTLQSIYVATNSYYDTNNSNVIDKCNKVEELSIKLNKYKQELEELKEV